MFEQYFTIPFELGGRTHEGCDCYGLVRLVLKEQRGIILPSFSDVCDGGSFDKVASMFSLLSTPEDWCIASMRGIGRGYFAHVGLYYKGYILHIMESGVAMQKADRLGYLIRGYYRPLIKP